MSRIKIWLVRSSIISLAPGAEFASRFLRTVILSRLLVPEEFGTSVALGVVIGMANMITDVGVDRFAMFSDDRNSRALPALHLLFAARGFTIAFVLAAAAPALAALFRVPQFSGSFMFIAAIPLIGSFAHLGVKQVQRDYDYLPDTLATVFANFSAILILVLAVKIFGDHRAILAGFLTEALVYVIASHALARVQYRIRPDRATLLAALKFGLPLVANGVGLAIMSQMDRTLIGHWFGVDLLARYAILTSISIIPISLIVRVFGTAALSYLIVSKDRGFSSARNYHFVVCFFCIVAVSYTLFVAITMDVITPLIFGRKYTVDVTAHVLITAIVFLRLQCHGAPTNQLLATGQTRQLAVLNLTRGLGLACAVIFMLFRPEFNLMLVGFLIGDIVAFLLFFVVSSARVLSEGPGSAIDVAASLVAALVICGILQHLPEITWQARAVVFTAGLLGIATQVLIGFRPDGPLRSLLGARLPEPSPNSRAEDSL